MKDYLGMILESDSDVSHRVIEEWSESMVSRNAGGQFSSGGGGGKWKPDKAWLDKLKHEIGISPEYLNLLGKQLGIVLTDHNLTMDQYIDVPEEQAVEIDNAVYTALTPKINTILAEKAVSPDGKQVVQMRMKPGTGGRLTDDYYVVPKKSLGHSDDTPDYIGAFEVEEGDKLDYGILGMKWGKRRPSSEIAKDTAKRKAEGEKVTPTKKAAAIKPDSSPDKTPVTETSSTRYARLAQQAKGGGAKDMSEIDLKFFNARTEALAKVNKMNQSEPGWMSKTAKKVIQTTAERSLQSVSDAVAGKFITDPIISGLKDNSAAIKAESKTSTDYIGKHRAKK